MKKNDELYTPPILVEPIITYLKKYILEKGYSYTNPIYVWCPFDMPNSEFVLMLQTLPEVRVVYSHIILGQDFFEYQPAHWDIAISNPPFSLKKKVFQRLFDLKKPFAMIMNIMALNYQEIGTMFVSNPVQLLIPDKKVSFDGNTSSFCSGYVCKDFLPKDLIFYHLEHNNSGENFVKSRMTLEAMNNATDDE